MNTRQTPFLERKSTTITCGIGIVLLLAGQWFLWKQVERSALLLHMRQTNEQQYAMVSLQLLEAQQSLEAHAPSFATLGDVLPSRDTLSQVLGRMEGLADTHGVSLSIKSIESAETVAAGSQEIVPHVFAAEVQGAAENLLVFLDALENQKQLGHIDSWELSSSGPSVSGSFQAFVLKLRIVYYFL